LKTKLVIFPSFHVCSDEDWLALGNDVAVKKITNPRHSAPIEKAQHALVPVHPLFISYLTKPL
jgi:hypothetical protein